jgi:hypothetical protein
MGGTDGFSFGNCKRCGKMGALKNGVCSKCRFDVPDFLINLFGGKDE